MVGGNGVGNVFHQDGLARLRLRNYQRALSFTNRREDVDNPCAEISCLRVTAEIEFLVREKRSQVLKGILSRISDGFLPLMKSMDVSGKYFSPS